MELIRFRKRVKIKVAAVPAGSLYEVNGAITNRVYMAVRDKAGRRMAVDMSGLIYDVPERDLNCGVTLIRGSFMEEEV